MRYLASRCVIKTCILNFIIRTIPQRCFIDPSPYANTETRYPMLRPKLYAVDKILQLISDIIRFLSDIRWYYWTDQFLHEYNQVCTHASSRLGQDGSSRIYIVLPQENIICSTPHTPEKHGRKIPVVQHLYIIAGSIGCSDYPQVTACKLIN